MVTLGYGDNSMKILRVLAVSPLLILAACTLSTPQKETANLTLHLNAPLRLGPGTIAGFDCLAINVVGGGIPSSDPSDTAHAAPGNRFFGIAAPNGNPALQFVGAPPY